MSYSRGRTTRLIALTTAYQRLDQAAFNPYLTFRERRQLIDETFVVINRILGEEYTQGYQDGADFAVTTTEEILKEQR